MQNFTLKTQESLNEAKQVAVSYKHTSLLPEHLLIAIF